MSRVKPKKHLGQHFLKDENIALKIVNALSISGNDTIIEVGPGTGVLTRHLMQNDNFLAFDVDSESIEYLKSTYPEHSDKFRLQDFLSGSLEVHGPAIKVIGNFPYNISSQLFFAIYDHRERVNEVVCMIQKEVADRIVSPPGNKVYGILSVLLKAFYDLEYLFTVKPGVFNPPPRVNSGVIRLTRNGVKKLDCDEILFKRVVKAGFGQRRKTLRNALKTINMPKQLTAEPVLDKRAEQLEVSDFVYLTQKFAEYA